MWQLGFKKISPFIQRQRALLQGTSAHTHTHRHARPHKWPQGRLAPLGGAALHRAGQHLMQLRFITLLIDDSIFLHLTANPCF